MLELHNVLAWIRKVDIPPSLTQSINGYNYAGVSLSTNSSIGFLRFELGNRIALLVFEEKDLANHGMDSF